MNKKQLELLGKIREHLFKLHTAWSKDPNSDGHCKSSEGYIQVSLNYPNWFNAKDYLKDEPEVSISVYSYLFGPNRMHDFVSLEKAWAEVKTWTYTLN